MKNIITAILMLASFCAFAQPIPPPVIYPITVVKGGTGGATAPDDNLLIGTGTAWTRTTIPDCPDTGGNHLNYVQSTNSLSCGTSGGSSETLIIKGSDTQRASNTTFSPDPDLQFSMTANTDYVIHMKVFAYALAVADIKWTFTGPASPTYFRILASQSLPQSTTPTFLATSTNPNIYGASYSVSYLSDGIAILDITAYVRNAANTGTFAFEWAQAASDPTASIVLAGSYMQFIAQ